MAEVADTASDAIAALGDSPTADEVLDATAGFSSREIATAAAASGGGGDFNGGTITDPLDIDLTVEDGSQAPLTVHVPGDPADYNIGLRVVAGNDPDEDDATVFTVDSAFANLIGYLAITQPSGGTYDLLQINNSLAQPRFRVNSSGSIFAPSLPTSDPHVADQLWNNAGTLKVSAG